MFAETPVKNLRSKGEMADPRVQKCGALTHKLSPKLGVRAAKPASGASTPGNQFGLTTIVRNRTMPTATLEKIDPKIREFVTSKRGLLIDGKWVDAKSGQTFPVYNPATGEVLDECAAGEKADIDLAVKAARRAFEQGPWSRITPGQRGRLIWKLADLIESHLDEFAQIESLDNGKPLAVARVADVPLSVDLLRYMAGWSTKIDGQTLSTSQLGSDFFAYTLREPVGVVGQIIPWNFPLLMAVWKLGPALATGCTVVLKPAEQTPLSALRLGELIEEAGFPPGVVNIVTGYGETAGAALAAHPDVDKVAFTGSTEVGKLIVQAAAGNLKKVSLELGGKSPNIVFGDADLEMAIPGAASAIFFNHGQCCCAGSRLYVQKKIFDEVVGGVTEHAKKIKVREGFNPESEMGPLVSEEQLNRVLGFLESGKADGVETVIGGNRIGNRGYFVEPTVLTGARPGMKVIDEEIFGPVVCAMPFDELDEVATQMNQTSYGLAGAIWTKDISKANRMARAMRAGTVWINCYNIFDAALPFGGYKQSGWGREMGKEAIEMYTEVKSVCLKV
jgi:phenylacetaldehyde dehydrogenase